VGSKVARAASSPGLEQPATDELEQADSAAGLVHTAAVIPFEPITLVCRNLR
jgi:hypothetical protein